MNYQKIYTDIIERAKTRILYTYTEKHHIIPRCLGGLNTKTNIVKLTAKEHYLVHFLLIRIYPNNSKLVYAFWMMCNGSRPNRPKTNMAMYKIAKELLIEVNKGRPSPMKGKKHSEDAKSKMSLAKKGREDLIGKKHSLESRLKMSISCKGRKLSSETKEKISKSHMGKVISAQTRQKMSDNRSGINNYLAKLTWEKVALIREEYTTTKISQRKLAKKYNVTQANIQCILTNKTWKIT